MRTSITLALACFILAANVFAADPEEEIPVIVQIKGVKASPQIFKDAKRGKPIEIKSLDDAKEWLGDDALKELEKHVDFEKQFVLVFAWRGSGQDKLQYDVVETETDPPSVEFRIIPGRTRDLRPHFKAYALAADTQWSVGRGRPR